MQTLIDPVFRSKMPLFDGSIAAGGLSKQQNMPGFLDKHALQYTGSYFTYDPRGKDGGGFTAPWSNSKSSLLESRSPMSHLSGMEGQNHILFRQDSNSQEEGHPHSSSLCHPPVKQGFTLYTKSPGLAGLSPTGATSVAVRKQKSGGDNASPPSENSVYLAIPKPVYRHNPCCNELGCVKGQRFSVEQGSPRVPSTVYEHDWMQTNAHYTERQPIQRKAQDKLLQQRGLQFEPHAEPVKRITVEAFSPSRASALPVMMDPNYSSYPCTPTRTLFGSLSEKSQQLQTSPRAYPGLYPTHPTYEHMTSEVYQERSPMSKYGQLTQHPVFYYPQANEEVQNSTQCKSIGSKQREDVPVILKHTISNPREHYIVPQSLHGEIHLPLPNTEIFPNHSFIQGFDYPCYAVPRFHLNTTPVRVSHKRQHTSPTLHTNSANISPSSQRRDPPTAASLHKDKPNTSLHADQSQPSSPFIHVNQTSPARCVSQPGVSPPGLQMNRFFPSLPSLHMDRHILPPSGLNMNRFMDYSPCEARATCPQQSKGLPVSPAAWLPQSPSHSSDRIHAAVSSTANARKIIYSPSVATGNRYNSPTSSSGPTVLKGSLKRSLSHSSPAVKIKEEGRDLCEVDISKKRQRVETENAPVGNKTDSPPMPVIDNVFSLAPYQAYLQASGVLFPGKVPHRTVQSSEHSEGKTKSETKEKRPDGAKQQSVVCPVSKDILPDTPSSEKPVVEIMEPKNIKVENVDPSDTDNTAESPRAEYSSIIVKKELVETDSCDIDPVCVIKKCEPEEPESKTCLLNDSGTDETSRLNSSSQDDACTLHEQVAARQSEPSTSPQPSERKLNFKNIPPQCLKLSTYKIILPDMKHSTPVQPPEMPPLQPTTDLIPKVDLQLPVRKHFLELHHSLCKLVSKSVLASSEQELRIWLSQLKLTEPESPSTKVQKVSCLLGVKAREVWLNEEIELALHNVTERLREYTIQKRCPFPHVMRTGAVFLPMLVMKEILFPMVQGSFIDQVLQEHRVELRPTTLSEEKILIQLHKRACSSRLRRLMSLKHLPDIYADVINLLYYSCVCKHLGECMFTSVSLR